VFQVGEPIEVVQKEGGWWFGRRARLGWFPAECVAATKPLKAADGEVLEPVAGIVFCPFEDWLT